MQQSINAFNLPSFSNIQPENIESELTAILARNRKKLHDILSQTSFTWDNLMQPIEEMQDELSNYWAPISHLHSVKETESLRQAYNKTIPILTEYHTELSQNEKLYQAVSSLVAQKELMNAAQRKIVENDLRDFELAGIHLPADEKLKMAALEKDLSLNMTKFSENTLDATQAWFLHVTNENDLHGLPPEALQLAKENAEKRGLKGHVLTLDFPSYSTAIRFVQNRDIRQKMYEAYATRASDHGPNANQFDNTEIMERLLHIREQMARLVGYETYAHYSLATKMAKTPDEVLGFLYDLLKRSKPIAEQEAELVKKIAHEMDGIDQLMSWDAAYYSEKLREQQFNFSPEDLRPYFPIQTVLQGMFAIVKKIYSLDITAHENVETWHKDVKFFTIKDGEGHLRGGFYTDLYARPHKRDGAWMDDCRARRAKDGKVIQYPVAFLTCNFMPPVEDKPALLTHDDVLTLFHEFGHCLHHMLTKVDYPSVGGINGVPWDAVEFPSQFMENFCWDKKALDLIAAHYKTGEPLPDELYQKMIAAKDFQTGLQMVRQIEFSIFDFRLHLEFDPTKAKQVQTVLDDVRKETSIIPVPLYNRFQHSFSHIFAGGYAAGYYSYKWAEVLSADAYQLFEENGIFNDQVGQKFMQSILEVGGVVDPMEAFVHFRGRQPKIDALLALNGITPSEGIHHATT